MFSWDSRHVSMIRIVFNKLPHTFTEDMKEGWTHLILYFFPGRVDDVTVFLFGFVFSKSRIIKSNMRNP